MTSISEKFQTLKARQQCALIPFITAGDPDLDTTAIALGILDSNGADFIELGVPYSDPLADGPIIQAAATRALQQGTTLEKVLTMLAEVTPKLQAPVILFTYYNPILNRGVKTFLAEIAGVGVRGLVVPDLPLEEAEELIATAAGYGIEVILLVAPTSSPQRIQEITRQSRGFIYLVSVTGVTGMRSHIQTRVQHILTDMQNITNKPIGVGFGISSPQQAQQVKDWGADAVIVGSAFVKKLATDNLTTGLPEIGKLCQELKTAISNAVGCV